MKDRRLNRLFKEDGKIMLLPLDHGATLGPVKGLENINCTLSKLLLYVDCVVLHKGVIKLNYELLCKRTLGVIMHLSAGNMLSPQIDRKVLVGSVEEAIALGCDGVSIHVNIGNEYDTEMIKDFAEVSRKCNELGMPLLAMMYARGNQIEDPYSVDNVKLVARFAQELGADIVKVNYTGNVEEFKEVTEGCQIPVVVAGGEIVSEERLLSNIDGALLAGAKGVAIGRNIFQSDNGIALIKKIDKKIHG